MATFESARAVEQACWQMRYADYPRGLNRSRINSLADGAPPYTESEERKNNIAINVNDLTLTRLCHDARLQLYQAFNKPGNYFSARSDFGAAHKRLERGLIVTRESNRVMKRSLEYLECTRSKLALDVLHGIGPSCWEDEDFWCPTPLGVEDVLMPSGTLVTFRNLPFFAIWRGYTVAELRKLTTGPHVDPGWNLDAVDRACKWADEQTARLYGQNTWAEYWHPEKQEQRFKSDSGIYSSDLVQTIDCFDFYFWSDEGGDKGWRRRIVFDAWGGSSMWARSYGPDRTMPDKNLLGSTKGEFVYDSGQRVWGRSLGEIIHFQLADLSAVGPFRYHAIRGLGFMLYAWSHLQNRLRCKSFEAIFENLMMYLRVRSLDEAERALKIELVSRGVLDDSVQFLQPGERWQPDANLAQMGLAECRQVIADNAASYVQDRNLSRDRVEKTKFQVMAEVQAMTSLVSAALTLAYTYQTHEYREIFRRLCRKNSRDKDANEFRARCLRQGVPEKMLVPDVWELEPERVMGAGNKTLEMAIAQQLMQWRAAYAPEGQQAILRQATLAITDDPGLTDTLVPESPGVSDAKHDATLAFGSLIAGARVMFTPDQNRMEIVETLIGELNLAVQQGLRTGGMVSQERLLGLQNAAMHITELIGQIAQDQDQKERAKQYEEALGQLVAQIKAFAQRLEQAQKAAATQNGQGDKRAETAAKVQAAIITAQAKAANTRESHAQRTAQREAQFLMEMQQTEARNAQELRHKAAQNALDARRELTQGALDAHLSDIKTAAEMRRTRLRPTEPNE